MNIQTTINQLGGNQIFVMAFIAKATMANENSVTLKVAPSLAKSIKITHVRVTLAADDTYTVETIRVKGYDVFPIKTLDMVYCDSLRSTVESMTGLRMGL